MYNKDHNLTRQQVEIGYSAIDIEEKGFSEFINFFINYISLFN